MATLEALAAAATAAEEPGFTPPGRTRFGGVDPLGMRQINFDLMDEVLPGLNNVARHVRPFVVVAWAWRRAGQRARALGKSTIPQDQLQDFVDRIEVLFVLSQVLRDGTADLPGSRYLGSWFKDGRLKFGGAKWQRRREERRYSTALSAPVNYGPGLRMLGWVRPHPEYAGVMIPNPVVGPALDALEAELGDALGHEAFRELGPVRVALDDLRRWGGLWALEDVTDTEKGVMAELLIGVAAPVRRRLCVELMRYAVRHDRATGTERVRAAMTGPPAGFQPPDRLLTVRQKWRLLQVRQLFRLSLEAFFFWMMRALDGRKRSIESLVREFVDGVPGRLAEGTVEAWIGRLMSREQGPTELMGIIEQALDDPEMRDLPHSIARGLALSLSEETPDLKQQRERLPLLQAQEETRARNGSSVREFLRHVLEAWVLAQHTYWSVGRGLADARAGGRVLLRLRVILEEGGWTVTPGSRVIGRPRPTPDRLRTALRLAQECDLLTR